MHIWDVFSMYTKEFTAKEHTHTHTHARTIQDEQTAQYTPALLSLGVSLSACGLVHQLCSLGEETTEILQLWQCLLSLQLGEPRLRKCRDYLLVNIIKINPDKHQANASENTVIKHLKSVVTFLSWYSHWLQRYLNTKPGKDLKFIE